MTQHEGEELWEKAFSRENLFAALQRRGPTLAILCSDHGTTYGEDGYTGHRLAHPVVWSVPYAEFLLPEIAV